MKPSRVVAGREFVDKCLNIRAPFQDQRVKFSALVSTTAGALQRGREMHCVTLLHLLARELPPKSHTSGKHFRGEIGQRRGWAATIATRFFRTFPSQRTRELRYAGTAVAGSYSIARRLERGRPVGARQSVAPG